ncbi:MAG: PASTA domain-containing protein [Acidimicrobiia bacterium]|nr:PASTA domain-containing protein [Acidimicrobiia bacterium]
MISNQDASRAFGGRYRLLEFVGEGSNARVYVAEDLTLRRRVALKILRADTAERAGFPERFADEMRATSALSHPRVLPVYDWGLEPQPYAVTEYLTGGSLAAVLREGYRLTPSQALMVGLEAARALVNIHKGDRAHLGLTPASILFDSGSRPYISDLGLAAALEAASEQPAGAADAGAIEAADPAGASTAAAAVDSGGAPVSYSRIDQARDVHDLALVLCEAVTGARNLTVDVGGPDPIPITALGPLQAVLERAIAADPIGRLTAAELASELLRVAPLLPRPDPLPLAILKAPPTDAGPIRDTGTEAFEQLGPTVSERSAIPHDDVPRRRWPGLVLAALLVMGGAAGGVWVWLSGGSDPTVPELGGHTGVAAASAAADSGWEVNEILVRAPGTERGDIVRTEPEAGASLGEGATLYVFVSLGEPLILVSDFAGLYGMTVDDAAGELDAAGFGVIGETLVNDEVVPVGNVIGLDVTEGVYELETGTDVTLLVSDGPADRRVPAVPESREPRAAADALAAIRLASGVVTEFSVDVPEGSVIGFRPASGNTVPIDSTVLVRVSLGPMPPPEPEEPAEGAEGEGLESESEGSPEESSDG